MFRLVSTKLNQSCILRSTINQSRSFSTKIEKQGISFEEVKEGSGQPAVNGDQVSVHYIGKLENGKVFDQSIKRGPFTFDLGAGQVIKGWEIGVEGMKKGGKRVLTIPHQFGYGTRGYPPVIPPSATLIFDVEVMDIKK